MQWSNGHFFFAIVEDLDGDELCFSGPGEGLSGDEKIVPVPGAFGLRLTLRCMRQFGQIYPAPKAAFLVWR